MKITLAGTEYEIEQLTLGQIEDLGVALVLAESQDPQEEIKRSYQRALGVISAALTRAFPEMTPEKMRGMLITRAELRDAQAAILKHSGLKIAEDENSQGESPAGTP